MSRVPRLHPTVLLLAATHCLVDGYGNILAPLLPLLITRLDLSLAAAGMMTMLFQLAASVAQVGFGHLADRWNPRLLVMVGPVVSVSILSLVGLASSREAIFSAAKIDVSAYQTIRTIEELDRWIAMARAAGSETCSASRSSTPTRSRQRWCE